MSEWVTALPAFLVTAAALVIPGLVILITGWGWRRPSVLFLAPAVSTAVIALSAVAAPLVGLRWSLAPIAVVTIVIALVALALRRAAGSTTRPPVRIAAWIAASAGFFAASITLLVQFARAFGSPHDIAQRFDNIVHLNSVAFAVQTGNASSFHIGATSDISFYPGAWHALAALAAPFADGSVPVAVNAANLAVVAILWPASSLALTAVLFGTRPIAMITTAALTTGFGAFPALFFNWGVLYPNAVGYAMIPAAVAAVAAALRVRGRWAIVRDVLLVLLILGGTGLGHPNAALAVFVFSAAFVVNSLAQRAVTTRSRRDLIVLAVWIGALLVVFAGLWRVARTGAEHSGWAPWQSIAQAFGEAVFVAPRGFVNTYLIVALVFVGLIAAVRSPRALPTIAPFVVAVVLFVVASGFVADHWLRQFLTNPWYNDSNRLAALLPIAAIPVATLGAVWIADLVRTAAPRLFVHPWAGPAALTLAGVGLFSVALGPNVSGALAQVREAYTSTDDSLLLSTDEIALLERVEEEIEPDALIIGSPRTGASLAYAFASREVTEKHIFGLPSEDERFLNGNLRHIEDDPEVCDAVARTGVDYVLDFGRRDVIDSDGAANAYNGVQDLTPSEHLVLVDAEGDDARLFRIEGC